MIAIFARSMKDIKADIALFKPKSNFIYIQNGDSVAGRTFTGAIYLYKWWENKEAEQIYQSYFKHRYPNFTY